MRVAATGPGAAASTIGGEDGSPHWRRNLWVALFGSFTTVMAMTLLLPFLPIYVAELGVADPAAVAQWSGVAYGATFLTAGLVAPLWGRLADRHGRKLMLIRASAGMTVAMSLIGMARNPWQLVGLRLLTGLLGGYSSGSTILVATQTPKGRSGWALGTLSAGIMAGNLVGPLVGGVLPRLIGIRLTFFATGAIIFLAFLATTFLIHEERRPLAVLAAKAKGGWSAIPDKRPVAAMLVLAALLLFAMMSIEPIITVYVGQIVADPAQVTMVAGLVMSATALGSILSAPRLGRLGDRIGHARVVVGCLLVTALLLVPQAFVTAGWQLVLLRGLMGVALGGLMPAITSIIRHSVPERVAGTILGYSVSAQYVGQVLGPLAGGWIGGHYGMRAVFLATAALLAASGVAMGMRRRADGIAPLAATEIAPASKEPAADADRPRLP